MSYARTDQRFVDRLMGDLEANGFGVWRDVDKLRGGDTWREAISEAIRGSDAVVIVLSPDSVASRNVSKELSVAEERNMRATYPGSDCDDRQPDADMLISEIEIRVAPA